MALAKSVSTASFKSFIESLHEAVRTYTHTIPPNAWFPSCMAWYREKQQQTLELMICKIYTKCESANNILVTVL